MYIILLKFKTRILQYAIGNKNESYFSIAHLQLGTSYFPGKVFFFILNNVA